MVKVNNFTLAQIHKNLSLFYKKLIDKKLISNFWVIADRADFKPLKKKNIVKKKEIISNIHSIKEIRDNILSVKGEYYKDKKFAEIKIIIEPELLEKINDITQYKNIKKKIIMTAHIVIYLIDSFGELNLNDKWELKVNYFVDDFRTINFKLKNIEVLMRLAADSVIKTNNIDGISYKNFLAQINKK